MPRTRKRGRAFGGSGEEHQERARATAASAQAAATAAGVKFQLGDCAGGIRNLRSAAKYYGAFLTHAEASTDMLVFGGVNQKLHKRLDALEAEAARCCRR